MSYVINVTVLPSAEMSWREDNTIQNWQEKGEGLG